MKKVIFLGITLCFSLCLFAQTDSTNSKVPYNKDQDQMNTDKTRDQNQMSNDKTRNQDPMSTDKTRDQNRMSNDKTKNQEQMSKDITHENKYNSFPDGVIMKNGKMMRVKNGKLMTMDQEMTLSNGSIIRSDGSIMKKDGTRMMIKEGQHIDMSGNMDKTTTKKILTKKTTVKQSTREATKKKKDMYLIPNDQLKKDTIKR